MSDKQYSALIDLIIYLGIYIGIFIMLSIDNPFRQILIAIFTFGFWFGAKGAKSN